MSSSAVRLIRPSRSRTTSIVRLPRLRGRMPTHWCRVRSSARRRTRRLRPRLRVSTARCRRRRRSGEQGVGVLVDQRPREVGLVLPIGVHLDERLDVDEAGPSCSQIPFASPCVHSSAGTIRTVTPISSAASVNWLTRSPPSPVASVSRSGSGSPSVWEMSNTDAGLNPTSPFDHSSFGASS